LAWISTSVAGELGEVGDRAKEGLEEVRDFLTDKFDLSRAQLERVQDQITSSAQSGGSGGVARQVIGGARLAVQVVGGLVLALFTLFFVLKDGHKIADWLQARLSDRYRRDLAVIATESGKVMRQYLKATALTGLIDAVLIGIGIWIVGVPLVLPLALLTFLGGFVPIIGAFVAGLLAALVALVSNGPADALIVVAIAVGVQQVEGNLLQPFILGPAVRLHELVTVLVVAAGLALGGILGAFLSVPIVAIIVKVAHYYRERPAVIEPTLPPTGEAGAAGGG
jgi:predicted PurR-regulated permease PerM